MIQPDYLKTGDKVALAAPARWVLKKDINHFLNLLKEWGLNPILAENIFIQEHQLAGNQDKRLSELVGMLADPEIKAIFCVRGGYGTIHLLRGLEDAINNVKTKWIIGYSDVTVLHAFMQNRLMTESIHAIMPYSMRPDVKAEQASAGTLRKAIFGEQLEYEFEPHSLNRTGNTTGILTGGNLSVLYSLSGTEIQYDTEGRILFIEDVDEYLYHLDRMMFNLKLSGHLEGLSGMIIGHMTDMRDNEIPFGKNAYRIIADVAEEYDFPVCFGFPAGHEEPNLALILGRKIDLTVSKENCRVTFHR